MKFLLFLALLVGLAVALESTGLEKRHRTHKKTHRPKKWTGPATMAAAPVPKGAPSGFKCSLDKCSRKRSKAGLQKLPADLVDPDSRRRRDSLTVLRTLKRQSAADFYECPSANPPPADADCQVIIDQIYSIGEDLVVTANACLTFGYQTCTGFFCSLCQDLSTSTDFIGNQLDSAETLCVSSGSDGTVVGEDAPQWDSGFVRTGESLPSYDVC